MHSFDDLPARIVYVEMKDDYGVRYEWFIDGKQGRENNNLPCMELKGNNNLPYTEFKRNNDMYFEVAYCLNDGLFRLLTYNKHGFKVKDGIARRENDQYVYTDEEYKLDFNVSDPYEERNLEIKAAPYKIFNEEEINFDLIGQEPRLSRHDLETDEWFNRIEENEPNIDSEEYTDDENSNIPVIGNEETDFNIDMAPPVLRRQI